MTRQRIANRSSILALPLSDCSIRSRYLSVSSRSLIRSRPSAVVLVLGLLAPAPGFLLVLELLHRVVGLPRRLPALLLLLAVLADQPFGLGLAVERVAVEQLLLLVVVAGVAGLDFLLEGLALRVEVRTRTATRRWCSSGSDTSTHARSMRSATYSWSSHSPSSVSMPASA